ncbi:MAG: hypothetical protein ABI618_20250, partial [Nitrospirota bacterium]
WVGGKKYSKIKGLRLCSSRRNARRSETSVIEEGFGATVPLANSRRLKNKHSRTLLILQAIARHPVNASLDI